MGRRILSESSQNLRRFVALEKSSRMVPRDLKVFVMFAFVGGCMQNGITVAGGGRRRSVTIGAAVNKKRESDILGPCRSAQALETFLDSIHP